ncbi:hypothetical protein F1559_004042 [Cyanidiococcus yangmingshanensis]|uniref:Uncharacterized protein n=1 Tax=Cyanidiococcus yangmingshanensis TaxID=2690220 RepID=A0A7J7IH39_9RHOD|nr:hypothetical protein F1559_004042 [Cyanidiococcus yangmingshanensis]
MLDGTVLASLVVVAAAAAMPAGWPASSRRARIVSRDRNTQSVGFYRSLSVGIVKRFERCWIPDFTMLCFQSSFFPGATLKTGLSICTAPRSLRLGTRSRVLAARALRMSVDEQDRLTVRKQAQICLEDGCSLEDLDALLDRTRLIRDELMKDVKELNDIITKLQALSEASKKLPGGEVADTVTIPVTGKEARLEDVVRAVLRIFSRAEDHYPRIGLQPWSMDKPKKNKKKRF